MSLTVRDDLSVPIPEALAEEMGLHAGSQVEWERTDDGALKLRTVSERLAAFDRLGEILKGTFEPGESGMGWFLKWRQEERELDPTYRQW